ncbi:hypothetical protein [Neolewinella persica]|uniref:hypothetical protein n=1 Tax=Neolewinella persica TaxID=70998 RepID=UPI000367D5EA|nr:hypothetical protein [Neolewinella persica]
MEALMQPYFNWTNLILVALLLWGVYLLLSYLKRSMQGSALLGRHQRRAMEILSGFLLLYEPLTVLTLTMIFLFINPFTHGIMLMVIILAAFTRIRDYVSGRIIQTSSLLVEGKRMKTAKSTGVISRIGRMGLYLQTGEGLHFVNYSKLLTEGYSLATGKEVGGYYQLHILPKEMEEEESIRFLENKFVSTPYLDRSFRPELTINEKNDREIMARIAVREDQHLRELLQLMEEWGYPARIARK